MDLKRKARGNILKAKEIMLLCERLYIDEKDIFERRWYADRRVEIAIKEERERIIKAFKNFEFKETDFPIDISIKLGRLISHLSTSTPSI